MSAFGEALAEYLTEEYARYGWHREPIQASDIKSVWTYQFEGEASLDIEVTLHDGRRIKVDPAFVIGQMIQAML